jgi:hypothetical protein
MMVCFNVDSECQQSYIENQMNFETVTDAYLYAYDMDPFERIPEVEALIATDAEYAYLYARNIINCAFPEGEPIIATSGRFSFYYARAVIRGRWLDGELTILFSEYANEYATFVNLPSE